MLRSAKSIGEFPVNFSLNCDGFAASKVTVDRFLHFSGGRPRNVPSELLLTV